MPTAFVTGVSGQTGSYLVERLVDSGWNVSGLVRSGDALASAVADRNPSVGFVEGDLADSDGLRSIVARVEPDVIFNLGGLTSVAQSWKDPHATAVVTGLSVATLLDAAWTLQNESGRVIRFVQASSAEMFGEPSESPQTESTLVHPLNPYGAAKAYAHMLVGIYRGLGVAASSCILYNHESPRRPDTFVTRKITRAVARISLGLEGSLSLGSLDSRRDWGWAPDYAHAIALVAEAPADDFVIASGVSHSVRDFVSAAFAAAGIDDWERYVEFDPAFQRPQDASELVGDSTKIRTQLGWAPTVTFDELVARMVHHDIELERQSAR